MQRSVRNKMPLAMGLLFVTMALSGLSGCKKAKKGVLEVRSYVMMKWYSINEISISESYMAYLAGNKDIDLKEGEVARYEEPVDNALADVSIKVTEYIYHSDESPSSLGYSMRDKEAMPGNTPYGDFSDVYVNKERMYGAPGNKHSHWKFSGKWKHEGSGLVIWVDNDKNGDALIVQTGSAFPEEVKGDICMMEINHSGGNTWTGQFRTYYPGSGWRDRVFVQMELSEDGNSFTLGGETYVRY